MKFILRGLPGQCEKYTTSDKRKVNSVVVNKVADLNTEPDPIRSHRLGISYQTLRQTVVDQVPENKPASPNLTVRELRDFFLQESLCICPRSAFTFVKYLLYVRTSPWGMMSRAKQRDVVECPFATVRDPQRPP